MDKNAYDRRNKPIVILDIENGIATSGSLDVIDNPDFGEITGFIRNEPICSIDLPEEIKDTV